MQIEVDDLSSEDVRALLAGHLAEMHATSPPCSVHALDLDALLAPEVTVWSARVDGVLLGVGALKRLADEHGEVKSMRTATGARGTGVGGAVLATILAEAHSRGYRRVSLETGSEPFFEPARRLYARHGFTECAPFGDYVLDPNSVFMTIELPGGNP